MPDANSDKDRDTDKILDALIRGKTPEEILGQNGILKQLTKRLVERALEAEMTEHLGYEKHAVEGKNTGNSRNGKTRKSVTTETGEIELEVPRDRNGEFEPQIVPKSRRRLEGFDDKVLSLYARGMTTREIQGHLQELYGVEVSPALVSTVTDAVLDEVRIWQERPLEKVYPIVFLDAIHVKMRSNGHIQTTAVYLALAINREGMKELLGLWVGESEGAKFWLKVLTELRNRGLEDILIACVDGLKGFPEAVEAVFPKTQVQQCVVHMIRNTLRYVSWKQRSEVAHDLKTIYTALTEEAGLAALEAFRTKWDGKFPSLGRSWQQNWATLAPFFGYPAPIRKVIYTTNTIESINSSIRKVTKKRGAFPTEESVRKVIYLAIQKASIKWTQALTDWGSALNYFAVLFEGRI
jgi:putative transposase